MPWYYLNRDMSSHFGNRHTQGHWFLCSTAPKQGCRGPMLSAGPHLISSNANPNPKLEMPTLRRQGDKQGRSRQILKIPP